MKKFGTPIGAGPGRANENVGLAGVGTPPFVRGCGAGFGLPGGFDPPEPPPLDPPELPGWRELGCNCPPWLVGADDGLELPGDRGDGDGLRFGFGFGFGVGDGVEGVVPVLVVGGGGGGVD